MAIEVSPPIAPEVLKDLHEAMRVAYSNVRDPEVMRKAAERMDRRAEKNAQLYGTHDMGANIVREMRDGR
jgi:hypothetical protein